VNLYTKLNKYFSECLNLMITQMSIQSMEPPFALPTWQNKYSKYQELKLEIVPLGQTMNRVYDFTLSITDEHLNYNKMDFDFTTVHIPEDIEGYDRVVMRLGYMIYQCYRAANGKIKASKDYPSYLVNWSISSRA